MRTEKTMQSDFGPQQIMPPPVNMWAVYALDDDKAPEGELLFSPVLFLAIELSPDTRYPALIDRALRQVVGYVNNYEEGLNSAESCSNFLGYVTSNPLIGNDLERITEAHIAHQDREKRARENPPRKNAAAVAALGL